MLLRGEWFGQFVESHGSILSNRPLPLPPNLAATPEKIYYRHQASVRSDFMPCQERDSFEYHIISLVDPSTDIIIPDISTFIDSRIVGNICIITPAEENMTHECVIYEIVPNGSKMLVEYVPPKIDQWEDLPVTITGTTHSFILRNFINARYVTFNETMLVYEPMDESQSVLMRVQDGKILAVQGDRIWDPHTAWSLFHHGLSMSRTHLIVTEFDTAVVYDLVGLNEVGRFRTGGELHGDRLFTRSHFTDDGSILVVPEDDMEDPERVEGVDEDWEDPMPSIYVHDPGSGGTRKVWMPSCGKYAMVVGREYVRAFGEGGWRRGDAMWFLKEVRKVEGEGVRTFGRCVVEGWEVEMTGDKAWA
ncbi:hypothetical protein HDV00_008396 [Rhizophlyctis rosea]|nr:hypothetical protein HDV00_008396 [Rhizophlyctis rosea]